MCAKYFSDSNETSGPYPNAWSSDKQQFLLCMMPKVEHHLRFHQQQQHHHHQQFIMRPSTRTHVTTHPVVRLSVHVFCLSRANRQLDKKLSCRRETARCFKSLSDKLQYAFCRIYHLLLICFTFHDRYLGDSDTDRRESLHDGTAVSQTMFCLFQWRYLQGSPNAESKTASGGPFLTSQTPIFAIYSEYLENGLHVNQSLTSVRRALSKMQAIARGGSSPGRPHKAKYVAFLRIC